MTLLHKR